MADDIEVQQWADTFYEWLPPKNLAKHRCFYKHIKMLV